jgi:hypothetical protein
MQGHPTFHDADEIQRIKREMSMRPRLDREHHDVHGRLHRAIATLTGRYAAPTGTPGTEVTIRRARPQDTQSVARLAAMSDRRPPHGPVLVAEVESVIVAALPIDGGPVVTDIRRPTTDVVQLLELRSDQERRAARISRAA